MAFNAFTGDETGLLKSINISDKRWSCFGGSVQSRNLGCISMAWNDPSETSENKFFTVLRRNSTVDYYKLGGEKMEEDDEEGVPKEGIVEKLAEFSIENFLNPGGCAMVGSPKDLSTMFFTNTGQVSIVKTNDRCLGAHETVRFDARGPISAGSV